MGACLGLGVAGCCVTHALAANRDIHCVHYTGQCKPCGHRYIHGPDIISITKVL